jgi:hypothetical protein
MIKDDSIRYSVRYRVAGTSGICVLPIWIPVKCDPLKYVRKVLINTYSREYDIVDLKVEPNVCL